MIFKDCTFTGSLSVLWVIFRTNDCSNRIYTIAGMTVFERMVAGTTTVRAQLLCSHNLTFIIFHAYGILHICVINSHFSPEEDTNL